MKFTNHHVSDVITRIRNAIMRNLNYVELPNIRVVKSIVNVLLEQGYISKFSEETECLKVQLKYMNGDAAIKQMTVVSKPSNRVYKKINEIPSYFNGLGITIVSTSKGIITDAQARELNVGGEVLCQVF